MEKEKTCTLCGVEKPLSAYGKNKNHSDGRQYYCRECVAVKRAERCAEARDWVNNYKMERGCTDCGYAVHPHALDLDHLPQYEKLFTVADQMHRHIDSVKAEVSKCEVVCANCHRIRTAERKLDV